MRLALILLLFFVMGVLAKPEQLSVSKEHEGSSESDEKGKPNSGSSGEVGDPGDKPDDSGSTNGGNVMDNAMQEIISYLRLDRRECVNDLMKMLSSGSLVKQMESLLKTISYKKIAQELQQIDPLLQLENVPLVKTSLKYITDVVSIPDSIINYMYSMMSTIFKYMYNLIL